MMQTDGVQLAIASGATAAPQDPLLEMIGASWMSQAISVAAELGLADHLASGAQSVAFLAAASQCNQASLHRLLRALTSLNIFIEQADGTFALTPTGERLRADAPQSVRSWAVWCGQYHWPVWAKLIGSVRTGVNARAASAHVAKVRALPGGMQGYAHIENDPQGAAVFNRAMVELTRLIAGKVVRLVDFSSARHVVDVGGGFGAMLATILSAHPHLKGTLFDLPHAVAGAAALMAEAGITLVCEIATGNFFDAVPPGADIYVLKSILHNWDDTHCSQILRNCREAMTANASLILIERIMPARLQATAIDRAVARSDLNMLVGLAGRERTTQELTALLGAAGFNMVRTQRVFLEFSVVEAVPV